MLFSKDVTKMSNAVLRDEFMLARRYFMTEAIATHGKLTPNMEQAARQMAAAETEGKACYKR